METRSYGVRLMALGWPAFIAACLLELVVFALVDPHEMHWGREPLGWSRVGVYTAAFFVFWAVSALGCALTALLVQPRSVSPASRS